MKFKKLIIIALCSLLAFGIILFLKSSSAATAIVWKISGQGQKLFPLVTISALIDSINPCAFSVLLLTIAFLFSLGITRKNMVKIGGAYIFGIFIAYLFIGLGILGALHIFDTPHFMGKVGAVLLIALGIINLVNEFFPQFPIKLKIPHIAHASMAKLMEKGSMAAVFILGGLVGLCEFPCTGGPYLMVLGLLHDKQTYARGLGYLIWYNILFVLPLVVVLFLASDKALLEKFQHWRNTNLNRTRFISGIVTILLGILIFFL